MLYPITAPARPPRKSTVEDFDELLSAHHLEQEIWAFVAQHERRPSIAEIAAALNMSAMALRRRLRAMGRARYRDIVTYSCVTYAAGLIRDGVKIEAARTLAGFRNKTNFCRQCRMFLGGLPHELRRPSQH